MKILSFVSIMMVVGLIGVVSVSLAQQDEDACPNLVYTALDTANNVCSQLSRNQICYGNVRIDVEPQTGITNLPFSEVGDIAEVTHISSLSLSPLNEATNEWGIAVMNLQASLPDTIPGQNLTFVMFGDVSLEVAPDITFEVTVTADAPVNIRSGPSTHHEVVGQAAVGLSMTANGRNESGDWVRVDFPERDSAWIAAFLLDTDEDIESLAVVAPDEPTPSSPTQAFYFRTGIGDAACGEAPDSGILIQTPEDSGEVQITLNSARINLGSTAYLQADAGGAMSTYVFEGQARLQASGLEQVIPAGTVLNLPLDEDLHPVEQSWSLEGYDTDQLQTVPISLLEREIEIAPPPEISYFSTYFCEVPEGQGPPIRPGSLAFIEVGISGYQSAEAAAEDLAGHTVVISVDGETFPIVRSDPITIHPSDTYGKSEWAAWIATPGTHIITGLLLTTTHEVNQTCTITVS